MQDHQVPCRATELLGEELEMVAALGEEQGRTAPLERGNITSSRMSAFLASSDAIAA